MATIANVKLVLQAFSNSVASQGSISLGILSAHILVPRSPQPENNRMIPDLTVAGGIPKEYLTLVSTRKG